MSHVCIISTWQEAGVYLRMLKRTLENDICPLPKVPGNAPFAIFREAFSYIDYLGYLYSGRGQVGDRSRQFMKRIMERRVTPIMEDEPLSCIKCTAVVRYTNLNQRCSKIVKVSY